MRGGERMRSGWYSMHVATPSLLFLPDASEKKPETELTGMDSAGIQQ